VEASGFRDALPRFEESDTVILGVSPDSVKKHCRFKEKYGLPYTLIADTDHAVAERYGVWQEKTMFGVKYWGNVRTTFLIGRDGRIVRRFDKVKAATHAEEVARAVEELAS
jgi:peroxiredoxin Q/BCP